MNDVVLDITYQGPELFEGVIIEAFGQGNIPQNTKLREYLLHEQGMFIAN